MISMADKHTPTPWKFDNTRGCRSIKGGKIGSSKQARYTEVACTVGLSNDDRDRANAELIVRAVNAHDSLVAALETTERGYDRLRAMAKCFGVSEEWNRDEVLEVAESVLEKCRAALALAKGGAK